MGQVFGRDCFLDNFKAGKQTLEVNENCFIYKCWYGWESEKKCT